MSKISDGKLYYEFEFIHPFADGNGRLGRLWQSLILARWNPLFAEIAVESLIYERQSDYYRAIQESTRQSDSEPFIAFILQAILDTINDSAPQVTPQVIPQVRILLKELKGEMGREQLQDTLHLTEGAMKGGWSPGNAEPLLGE